MVKPPAPSDLADKFMLRMPEGMRERIALQAKASGRSMNAEIVSRLQISLDNGVEFGDMDDETMQRIIAQHTKYIFKTILDSSKSMNKEQKDDLEMALLRAAEKFSSYEEGED